MLLRMDPRIQIIDLLTLIPFYVETEILSNIFRFEDAVDEVHYHHAGHYL